jgi:HSP20 family protein
MVTLREAMDHLFNEAFTRPFSMTQGLGIPSVDLYQTDDEIVVTAALPGLKAEDVEIVVTGDLLTLKGEYKEKEDTKKRSYALREQRFSSFERNLALPAEVEAEHAKAEFENGILTITLPKAETVKPKTITVKAR